MKRMVFASIALVTLIASQFRLCMLLMIQRQRTNTSTSAWWLNPCLNVLRASYHNGEMLFLYSKNILHNLHRKNDKNREPIREPAFLKAIMATGDTWRRWLLAGSVPLYYGTYYGTKKKGLQIISVSPCFIWLLN